MDHITGYCHYMTMLYLLIICSFLAETYNMVAARKGDSDTDISYKRSAPSSNGKPTTSNKKAKTEKLAKDGHLEVGDDGQLGFKDEKEDNKDEQDTRDTVDEGKDERMREIERKPTTAQPNQSGEQSKSLKGETKQEVGETDLMVHEDTR